MFFAIWVLTEVLIDSIPIEISFFFKIRKNNQEKFLELLGISAPRKISSHIPNPRARKI